MPVAGLTAWAIALAELGPDVPSDALKSFLDTCRRTDKQIGQGRVHEGPGDVVYRLQPLMEYLERSGGQNADSVLPDVVQQLEGLSSAWQQQAGDAGELAAAAAKLFASIRSVLVMDEVKGALTQSLSNAVATSVLSPLLELHASGGGPETSTVAAVITKALTHSAEFDHHKAAPVLPKDAVALLSKVMGAAAGSAGAYADARAIALLSTLANAVVPPEQRFSGGAAPAPTPTPTPGRPLAATRRAAPARHGSSDNGNGNGGVTAAAPSDVEPPSAAFLSPSQSFASASSNFPSVASSIEVHLGLGLGAGELGALQEVAKWALRVVRLALQSLQSATSDPPGASPKPKAATLHTLPGGAAGATARAAARLAAIATAGLVLGDGGEQARQAPEVRGQLDEAVEVLTAVAASCIAAAGGLRAPDALPARERLLSATQLIFQDCAALATAARELGVEPSPALFSQMRAALLAAAALPDETSSSAAAAAAAAAAAVGGGGGGGASGGRGWFWDVGAALPLSTPDASSCSAQQRLCSRLAEAVSTALATNWKAGQHSFVQAMLILPDPSTATSAEQQVLTMCIGRTFVLLDCSDQFARMALPVLMDGMSGARAVQPTATCACIAKTLAAMAAASACRSPEPTWAYEQVLELLCRLTRDTSVSVQDGIKCLSYAHGKSSEHCGAMAEAFNILATSASRASNSVRLDLRLKLLSLFNDMGLHVGKSPGTVQDMAALLPAVAAASRDLQEPRTSRKLSMKDLFGAGEGASTYKATTALAKVLRSFWLYVGLFKLASGASPKAQREAAATIAQSTPLLLITDVHGEQETLTRLAAEFQERVACAGSAGEPTTLRNTLLASVDLRPGSAGPAPPLDSNKKAYLLAIATAETCRASAGRQGGGSGVGTNPLAVVLGYLQVVTPGTEEAAWLTLISERAFARHTAALASGIAAAPESTHPTLPHTSVLAPGVVLPRAGPEAEEAMGKVPGAAVLAAAEEAPADAGVEDLAVTLIQHLSNSGDQEDGCAPQVVEQAESYLKRLLALYPHLYWSHRCVMALLDMLDHEEGERPMSEVRPSVASGASSVVWRWLRTWVAAAAARAPSRTEALLHQFLGLRSSSASFAPSSTSSFATPASLRGGGGTTLGGAGAGGGSAALRGGGGGGGHGAALGAASAAAMRRSAELLALCADARRQGPRPGAGAGAAAAPLQDGTLALCRKQYFSGRVTGLHAAAVARTNGNGNGNGGGGGGGGGGEDDASGLAAQIAEALDSAVRHHHGPALLEEQYLAAAALLASSPVPSPVDSAPCFALLKGLCSVPLDRFNSEVMSLAVFAWTWVSTAAPEWLIPLTSRVVSAWCWSVDRRMGLFSVGGAGCEGEEEVLQGLQCHHLWLGYFNELWATLSDKHDAQHGALLQLLLRLLHHSLAAPSHLSPHPASAAARFRLLSLALRICQHTAAATRPPARPLAQGATQGAAAVAAAHAPGGWPLPLALLHDRILKAAALWFRSAPSFTARTTEQQAQEQVAALRDFATLLDRSQAPPSLSTSAMRAAAMPPAPAPAAAAPAPTGSPGRGGAAAAAVAAAAPGAKLKALASQILHLPIGKAGGAAGSGAGASAVARGPVWESPDVRSADVVELLKLLLSHEQERLQVWAAPLEPAGANGAAGGVVERVNKALWSKLVDTAWQVDPQVALALVSRFPTVKDVESRLQRLLTASASEPRVQALPAAAMLLASHAGTSPASLAALEMWAPAGPVEGLQLLASAAGSNPAVKAYALRCIANTKPEKIVSFLPQLVQTLRHDSGGNIQRTLLALAARSDLFAHQLIWALQTEEKPPEEAFNPEVKRSGWTPPKDCGLWTVSGSLRQAVLSSMTPLSRSYWEAENSYFDQITSISGVLKKYEKDERKARCAEELGRFQVHRQDLYVPTNPDCRVLAHIPASGTPMQSAAKVPILVAFTVSQGKDVVAPKAIEALQRKQEQGISSNGNGNGNGLQEDEEEGEELGARKRTLACIFKVGDDVRQDVLALQVIQILRDAYSTAGLDIYLCPYGCLPTGYERGVIEVVPNTKSRAGLGELSDGGLYDIFTAEFGAPHSPAFEAARRNFIISEAGYAIASYLLQAKDRHNGNILIDNEGHLVHIDFGFILEISPGGNMGFESAAFKLSHEMTQLLDPGGTRQSQHFKLFEQLCVRAYLAARTVAEPIIATVALMSESGLPCFGRGAPIENLRKRFHLEMSERQAAQFMVRTIADAYDKWTTGFYDAIQNIQNRIPF